LCGLENCLDHEITALAINPVYFLLLFFIGGLPCQPLPMPLKMAKGPTPTIGNKPFLNFLLKMVLNSA